MVYRLYVEKKPDFAHEANALYNDLTSFLGVKNLERVRVINRYDVERIDKARFDALKYTVFSEARLDDCFDALDCGGAHTFAVEMLPGQFDQRADSCAQCVQLAFSCERPRVRTAKVYKLYGALSEADVRAVKKYVINPVECREASMEPFDTLEMEISPPKRAETISGFTRYDDAQLDDMRARLNLAMDKSDLICLRAYFASERRDPTLTEIRMLDTYWSDHCRHTTFLTHLNEMHIDDSDARAAYTRYLDIRAKLNITKPITLMDIATIGAKYLKSQGALKDLDESDEVNACTVKIKARTENGVEDWLLLFKNETHNHPTEIEPFGGAATCIGGAIRDPLSGRAYVYHAMRVTGGADPTRPVAQTIPGKLPQRKLATTAAAGYSSYGNQIGLATGLVEEWYHPGYAAKRLEIGAVIGAAPASNVRRETPAPGDVVLLLGGRTGRDGCGGATGSSKSHTQKSLETCGAEVQKGNAPEERKLQRLFMNPSAARMIKKCNDFGAGGVSVAIGELADGLIIELNKVPKKYEGLDATELAISESQERMAVVLAPEDEREFLKLCDMENIEATRVAAVTQAARLQMTLNGETIVDISRKFLDSNGASRAAAAHIKAMRMPARAGFDKNMRALVSDINICSRRGLAERFDSTIGAGTVLMPFGGARQLTPIQAMVAKLPLRTGETATCSVMSYGMNPYLTEASPYHGAYLAVVDSVAKLVAAGAGLEGAHLTFQEYFERMRGAESWGKPLAALLGALDAQLDLGIAAIGGKDSMSGSFEDLRVPPTLCSFAVNVIEEAKYVISPEFKRAGSRVRLIRPRKLENGLPDPESLKQTLETAARLIRAGEARAAWAVGYGGIAEGVFKMTLGNRLGFAFDDAFDASCIYDYDYGALILETDADAGIPIGRVTSEYTLRLNGETHDLRALTQLYESALETVYPTRASAAGEARAAAPKSYEYRAANHVRPRLKFARPRVLIPVFPGTNCELDTQAAFDRAGADTEVFVIRNLTARAVAESAEALAGKLKNAQILFLPGGFSGGDEPDGSGKFITAFLRNPLISEQLEALLNARDGLIGGICNGFQALIKLGLLPFGEIRMPDAKAPTLTYNAIARHQSRIVRTRVASNLSPWLMRANVGECYIAPVSHGEGRFVADEDTINALAKGGQIATQYADADGAPTMDINFNVNGSAAAIEGITSPDGRVFGKMAHSERAGGALYKNVPGNQNLGMFESAVEYFK